MIRYSPSLFAVAALLGVVAPAYGDDGYEQKVEPVLRRYCGDCHARATSGERWAFDAYDDHAARLADQTAWGKAEQLLRNRLMPPPGEPAPSEAERRTLRDWIDRSVFYVDPLRPDPGRTTLRRLNRAEYDNSVRDVLGVDFRPSEQFPADDSGYGFDTIGDVLSLSPLHLEKYLAAARQVAADAVRLSPPFRLGVDLPPERIAVFAGMPKLEPGVLLLRTPDDEVGATVDVDTPSVYRILARLAVAGGDGPDRRPRVDVLLDGKKLAELAPTTPWKGKAGFFPGSSAYVELPRGKHRLTLRMTPPAAAEPAPADKPVVAVGFYELSGPFMPLAPRPSEYLRRMFPGRLLGPHALYLSGEDLNAGSGRSGTDTGRVWFASEGYRRGPVTLPAGGKYRVRMKVGAQQVGPEQARFEVRVAGRTLGPFTVTVGSQAEQWVETECELPPGEHDWQVWFLNEYRDPASGRERWFWLHEFSIAGPLDARSADDEPGPTRDEVLGALKATGRRLFRRPLDDAEVRKLAKLVDAAEAAGQEPLAVLRTGLETLLISPKFLYHRRPEPGLLSGPGLPNEPVPAENGSVPIDEFTLAARLSYFLWSSVPDETLLSLAEQGALRGGLDEQVDRLLRDPKAAAFTANFAGQWLQLRDLEHLTPDPQKFPEFSAALAADMRRETELLFEHVLRENRPVTEFLDAEHTFVNARLAAHYGLPAPPGEGFVRVSLADTPRRGVLTHASILSITSHPTRTSPVKRGKWILEQILGTSPPPAPRDVPPLPDRPEDETRPLRARLEAHRADAACASCHALLDPPGFALEHYDAIGRRRTHDQGRPIDASGKLLTGESFADWTELRQVLVRDRRADFVRALTENLLTYALGRGLTYRDKTAVRAIVTQAEDPKFGFQDLIQAVCKSVSFQRTPVVAK